MTHSYLKSFLCTVLAISSFALNSVSAQADCRPVYQEKIKRLDGMLNPARATVIGNTVGSVMVPTVLAAAGVTITPAAVVAMPAVLLGVAGYWLTIETIKKSFEGTLRVIDAAVKQNDKDRLSGKLFKLLKGHNKKADPTYSIDSLQKRLADGNNSNEFCQVSPETGKVTLYPYHHLKHVLVRE